MRNNLRPLWNSQIYASRRVAIHVNKLTRRDLKSESSKLTYAEPWKSERLAFLKRNKEHKRKKDVVHSSSKKPLQNENDLTSEESSSSSGSEEESSRRGMEHKWVMHGLGSSAQIKPEFRYSSSKEFRQTNVLYVRDLSYSTYRLDDRFQTRSSQWTSKVRECIKRMAFKMKDHQIKGEGPIMFIDFLAWFVREVYIQKISGTQVFVALPTILTELAKNQHEAGVEMVPSEKDGVSSWPEAIQYLFENYSKPSHFSGATSDLGAWGRRYSERSVSSRLNSTRQPDTVGRCMHQRCRSQHSSMCCIGPFDRLLPTSAIQKNMPLISTLSTLNSARETQLELAWKSRD